MIFPSGLKRICDVCFYMTFASIIGEILGGEDLISTLPIFAFVAFLSAFLAPRGRIRFISIVPLFLVFVTTPFTVPNAVVLVPAIIFMAWTLPTSDERVAEFNYESVFRFFAMIFGGLIAIIVAVNGLVGNFTRPVIALPRASFLFALSFFLFSVMFMRMMRHDEAVFKQTRFKVMNAVSLVGVMIVVLLLSTDRFLAFAGNVFSLAWHYLLFPAILFLLWILNFGLRILGEILLFIIRILGIEGGFSFDFDPAMFYMPEPPEVEDYESVNGGFPNILVVIIAIVLVVLTIALFRVLVRKRRLSVVRDDGVLEERFSLDSEEKEKGRFRRRSENQIREVYRRFLVFINKKEANVPLHFNSSDVEGLVTREFKSEKSSDLRDEYIRVRYGDFEYTKDDVKRIRGLYKEVKGEIEGK